MSLLNIEEIWAQESSNSDCHFESDDDQDFTSTSNSKLSEIARKRRVRTNLKEIDTVVAGVHLTQNLFHLLSMSKNTPMKNCVSFAMCVVKN